MSGGGLASSPIGGFGQSTASEVNYRLALLPADTRIPDHSIWTHMQVVSALAGCVGNDGVWHPAFLKFQLGPVQDFIAAARSTRDLWSGSYLLSWLMAAGLKALSERVGPNAVVFPSLRGQPLFDLHWKRDLWSRVSINDREAVWDSIGWVEKDLLTPNLPNVFLAVVPGDQAAALGRVVCDAVRVEWLRIAAAVWESCELAGLTREESGIGARERRERFDAQVARFLSLSWQATPWPESLQGALDLARGFEDETPINRASRRVQAVVNMATNEMPLDHRDRRYYTDDSKTKLNNTGLGWSVILALNSWQLDAVRQTRQFQAAGTGRWRVGVFSNKDALTGRDEAVAGGAEWSKRAGDAHEFWPALFKKEDWLSAPTLIKRVWHRAYLEKEWDLRLGRHSFPMPNTRDISGHQPDNDSADEDTSEALEASEKYFAVIALDGDEIGKWASGEKTPQTSGQLADYTDFSGKQSCGARPYFQRAKFVDFLEGQRPLSPSYHLQFSEALSNFALRCARPIVEAFDGRLIYAGGDDILALVPADTALPCAFALRAAFRGESVLESLLSKAEGNVSKRRGRYSDRIHQAGFLLKSPAPGFLCSGESAADYAGRFIPFMVPGPKADASAGIAIAHFKAPLQDVVQEARLAEKRAKQELGRGAVAMSLIKRSGEMLHWGCKWDSGGIACHEAMLAALSEGALSAKFPHRLIELLEPYLLSGSRGLGAVQGADSFASVVDEVIARELAHAANRHPGNNYDAKRVASLVESLRAFLATVKSPERKVRDAIGLCSSVAFAFRTSPSPKDNRDVKGTS